MDVLLEYLITLVSSAVNLWSDHDFLGANFKRKLISASISLYLPIYYLLVEELSTHRPLDNVLLNYLGLLLAIFQ